MSYSNDACTVYNIAGKNEFEKNCQPTEKPFINNKSKGKEPTLQCQNQIETKNTLAHTQSRRLVVRNDSQCKKIIFCLHQFECVVSIQKSFETVFCSIFFLHVSVHIENFNVISFCSLADFDCWMCLVFFPLLFAKIQMN